MSLEGPLEEGTLEEMLTFLGDNIDIEAVFKAIVLATLKSSQTKALTKAYSVILDNLDDDRAHNQL